MEMTSSTQTFVLVPGAWHGAWTWDGIVDRLQAAGHRAIAVTLDGLETEPTVDGASANLVTHVDRVLAALDAGGPGPITLCGHSYAGFVIAGAADRSARPVHRLVYCDAFVPADGDSWWERANEYYRERVIAGARADGRTAAPRVGADPRTRPHPMPSFLQRLRLGDGIDRVRRRTLIYASGWASTTPLRGQYERLRSDPAWEVHELAVGHEVMNEAPDELFAIRTDGVDARPDRASTSAFSQVDLRRSTS
jgi:pimeloyl-ACP methyl ester carboxylesterase